MGIDQRERDGDPVSDKMLKAALYYAKFLRWPVIPVHSIMNGTCTCNRGECTSQGKHPRIGNWQDAATTDLNTIKKWWSNWPYSNIGIVTGEKSGVFVLDVDPKHNGHESLEHVIGQYGRLPDTVEAVTGSKGSHYLFSYVKGIKNKVDMLPGIDIRGDNGFVVVSPSIHISGNHYEWELSSHPLEVSVKDAPQWLLDMVIEQRSGTPQKKPSSHWVDLFNNTGEGNRNNAASQLAGHLFRRYVDPRLVMEIMYLWNESNVNPPLDIAELDQIINSIAGKELIRRKRKGG